MKDSQKYWEKHWNNFDEYFYETFDKETYDQLVSLEAKIWALESLIEIYESPLMAKDLPEWTTNTMHQNLKFLMCDYHPLTEKHNR
jgi:hypothetical protein